MKKNYNVVWGTDSYGGIELPFTHDMIWTCGNDVLACEDVDEIGLNEVEKEFRRRLYALSEEKVDRILKDYFYEKDDEEWLAEASREEKLRWIATLVEDQLSEEIDFENWDEISQPFELAA